MRTLAIDLGTRRVGLALSDAGGTLASPLEVIEVSSPQQAHEKVLAAIAEHQPVRLVVGLPLNMDGTIGPAVRQVMKWGRELASQAGLPVIFIDERLSSFEADQSLLSARRAGRKLTRKDRKHRQDAIAAAVFLQDFLDGKLLPLNPEP